MKTDVQIAQEAEIKPIKEIAEKIGVKEDDLEFYGKYKAKFSSDFLEKIKNNKTGKLVLVTAINPTPAGEGKTTTTVGLGQAMWKLGEKSSMITLREPSLGPCMGIKGGAAGGGYSQVIPMEDINLHFTGDIHAITMANNLISAILDNHLCKGNELNIDPTRILWKRVFDMNDRSLRKIVVGLGGKSNGVPREDGFMITVASEIMAIMCLSNDIKDLKSRIERILVAYSRKGNPITVKDLNCAGAVVVLLKDALKPNLVQTLEGSPAIIHGGPFANIAHGCNSVLATKTALRLSDIVITEAGFGADLGAEKFFDIKCRMAELKPSAVVLVSTIRSLKYNGGVDKKELTAPNLDAVKKGVVNLKRHIENLGKYGIPIIVTLNQFTSDTDEEVGFVKSECEKLGAEFVLSQVWEKGGEGGVELAKKVLEAIEKPSEFRYLYDEKLPIKDKIETIAKEIYRAKNVNYSAEANKAVRKLNKMGYDKLPVCIAKTQYSFSDNPKLLGAPEDFEIIIKTVRLSAGAGFVVAEAGDIMTMPGLPKRPSAEDIDVNESGDIVGLF